MSERQSGDKSPHSIWLSLASGLIVLLIAVGSFATSHAFAQQGPPEENEESISPSGVECFNEVLNASGLTNGVGTLEASADFWAGWSLDEVAPSSVVTSNLDIFSTDTLDTYFETEYVFTITRGQTCTWTLDSPACSTVESGGYQSAAIIDGCDDFDNGGAYALIFD